LLEWGSGVRAWDNFEPPDQPMPNGIVKAIP
jgi:hypothetical protein